MNRLIVSIPILLLVVLSSCATAIKTSGSASPPVRLQKLSVAFDPGFQLGQSKGLAHIATEADPTVRAFAAALSRVFEAKFPQRILAHGVSQATPGERAPSLRLRVSSYESTCRSASLGGCELTIEVAGDLIDEAAAPRWSFTALMKPEAMTAEAYAAEYNKFENSLIERMVADGLIAGPP